MALADVLKTAKRKRKIGLSEERVRPLIPIIRKYVGYWRDYPDMFVDFLQSGRSGEVPENGLKFYFYQRV